MVSGKKIAIVPARGGSKRIPSKNILEFSGKPMIVWALEAAKKSDLFDRIIVSTDDDSIKEVAESFGYEVPFLRQEFADDHSPVSLATISSIFQAEEYFKEEYQFVTQLLPTCPLRTSDHIFDAFSAFELANANFQLSCFAFGWMNPWWAFMLNKDNSPSYLFEQTVKAGIRSQDLPNLYAVSGSIWMAKVPELKKAGTFYGPNHIMFPIDWKAAVDIDDKEDLEFAYGIKSIAP